MSGIQIPLPPKVYKDPVETEKPRPSDGYRAIIIDPPWPIKKILRETVPTQGEDLDYKTMSVEQIKKLKLPADSEGCHLWLWTTHKYLPLSFPILDAWKARYVCAFVWHKNGGFQPFDLPQYNCEFALYARIGNPRKFLDLKEFSTAFFAPRGNHSEKPEIFYEMIRKKTESPRLDMFNRRKIPGFDGWGDESPA